MWNLEIKDLLPHLFPLFIFLLQRHLRTKTFLCFCFSSFSSSSWSPFSFGFLSCILYFTYFPCAIFTGTRKQEERNIYHIWYKEFRGKEHISHWQTLEIQLLCMFNVIEIEQLYKNCFVHYSSFYVLCGLFEGCVGSLGDTILAMKHKSFSMSQPWAKHSNTHMCEALIMYDGEFYECIHIRYNSGFEYSQCFWVLIQSGYINHT